MESETVRSGSALFYPSIFRLQGSGHILIAIKQVHISHQFFKLGSTRDMVAYRANALMFFLQYAFTILNTTIINIISCRISILV